MDQEKCNNAVRSEGVDVVGDPAFLAWCIGQGIEFGPIQAGLVSDGWRGVIATAPIASNECILRVPRAILLSCESARRDDHLNACIHNCGATLPPVAMLAVHLINEVSKGSESYWNVYLRSLPPSYTTAMCLTSAEAAALQVSYAQHQVAAATHASKEVYTQAAPVLRALNLPRKWTTLPAFFWALSTLSSRTMFLPHDDAGCLTPFGDLHNYAPPLPPITPHLEAEEESSEPAALHAEHDAGEWGDGSLDSTTNTYCIYARRQYNAGEEVFLCYGRHANLELLEHYGFVLQDNPHDNVVLPFTAIPEAVAVQLRDMGAAPILHADGNPSWELLRALRLGSLTPAQRKSSAWVALKDKKVDDVSERWALETLKKACQEALLGMETSVEKDEEILKIEGLSEGMRVAVQWRVGYKRILHKAIALCDHVLGQLNINLRSISAPLVNLIIRQPKLLGGSRTAVPSAAKD